MLNYKSILIVIVLLILLTSAVFAKQDTCPDGGLWYKIDSGDLSAYPVEGATQYCFKAGNWIEFEYPEQGFGNEGSCNDGIQYCELSHWSYFIDADPTITPTEIPPTETPTPSVTPTPDPTVTPTLDPSNTPTPDPTSTPTPGATSTPTPQPTSTPTPGVVTIEEQKQDIINELGRVPEMSFK